MVPFNLEALANLKEPLGDYTPQMTLSAEEQAMMRGDYGPVSQKIMHSVVRFGDMFGATHLEPLSGPVHSVASFSLIYLKPLFKILDELIKEGLKAQVPFTCNPLPTDYDNVDVSFGKKAAFKVMFPGQEALERNLEYLGLDKKKAFTCTCYQPEVGNVPNRGDILCWSESSAVSFGNSVLAARTNRNSGLLDFFQAIIGKAPYFGFLTDEGRKANYVIDIKTKDLPDPWILGATLGDLVLDGTPYIRGLDQFLGPKLNTEVKDYCKDMGAAAASHGSVGLYHLVS